MIGERLRKNLVTLLSGRSIQVNVPSFSESVAKCLTLPTNVNRERNEMVNSLVREDFRASSNYGAHVEH